MSDVAGHGNRHFDSYPEVAGRWLAPAFLAAGVPRALVRNMAVGALPSYPSSICMTDTMGMDADVVVWDYRMVEGRGDTLKGELFVRQALMMMGAHGRRRAAVAFKRPNDYLRRGGELALAYAEKAALHIVDETPLQRKLLARSPPLAALANETFCSDATPQRPCDCPGQVRWHSGWKVQRLRGVQLALVYLRALSRALDLLEAGAGAAALARDAEDAALPSPVSESCDSAYCSRPYRCATSVFPTTGQTLAAAIDAQAGAAGAVGGESEGGGLNATRWQLTFGNDRAKEATEKGHSLCGYRDSKEQLIGNDGSGWLFFRVPHVTEDEGASVAFCGEFPADIDLTGEKEGEASGEADPLLVLVNGEEVQGSTHALTAWPAVKTLGAQFACFSTSSNVLPGENELGFRVMKPGVEVKLTHVMWS